ncbi:MAG: glycosyltransferase family 4 protein [Leptolyngbyaceae cyanobacterium]
MRILFLDQSPKLGGAELCLADIAHSFQQTCLVAVFEEGEFPSYLRQRNIPVTVLGNQSLQVQKSSGLWAGLKSINQLLPLAVQVAKLSRNHDLIYANTQKALVVGIIASLFSQRPLVFHLHDIVSPDHFSPINRRLIITLANQAALIIANSQASQNAFIQSGGRSDRIHVVYNGFRPEDYDRRDDGDRLRHLLIPSASNQTPPFIIGHFSRLSPWKGQHILIEALQYCPDNVVAVLVGDALFGEQDYVQQLHQQVRTLSLEHRVHFLGFRTDVADLMNACDLIVHTSTAPEPFGRVIVEAMLSGIPVIAAAAGGATEVVEHGQTGWRSPPGNVQKLSDHILTCRNHPAQANAMAKRAQDLAAQHFHLEKTNLQIHRLLENIGVDHSSEYTN